MSLRAREGVPPEGSILVIMLSAVGDSVLVLPVVSALRRAHPGARITWVLQPGPHELVGNHPAVDEFILFRRGPRSRNPASVLNGLRSLRKTLRSIRESAARQAGGRFDLLLDLQVYFKAGLLTALAPARVKLGFDRARARDLNWLFTTHRIPPHPQGQGHIQDQYFEFLRFLGVDPEPVDYGLTLSREEREAQSRYMAGLGRRACSLVVASSDPRKNWNPDGYAELASHLHRKHDLQPLLVGDHSEAEEQLARAIIRRARGKVVDARGGGLRRLLWLLEGSALVVSPDTGPLHMARAVGTPVVGLYGSTNPRRSGPYRLFTDLVADGYARDPGEEYPVSRKRRSGGMARITTKMVVEKVDRALLRSPPPPPAGRG